MEIKKINHHYTAEILMTEREITALIEVFEENAKVLRISDEHLCAGVSGEIYKKLKKLKKIINP